MKSLVFLGCAAVVASVACSGGPGDPVSGCNDAAQAFCSRLYQCNDSTTIQNTLGYTSEADCQSKVEVAASCSTAGCPLGSKFDSSAASQCISDYQNEACGDTSEPSSCSDVCQ